MKPRPWKEVEPWRIQPPGYETVKGDDHGCFYVPVGVVKLACLVSAGDKTCPWEHVSVSIPGNRRCPSWEEMDFVKRLFWRDDETVMQLHVPRDEHKNFHPYCLHLWKPLKETIPRPPAIAVAP